MTAESQPETNGSLARASYRLPPAARTILLSMNPRAGSRARHSHVQGIADLLESAGHIVHATTDLETLSSAAIRLHESGDLRAVLAIGGDGTASVVRRRVPLDVPMLVIPMGTENLLGRYLRQSIDPAAVLAVVENGVVAEFDLGQANGQPFLLMISAGFDAEVIRALHESRRGNISRASYFLPALRAMRSYEYPLMRIYWNTAVATEAESAVCRWLFGFNLPLYALGLPIAANAVGTDGMLDVCTFERGTVWSVARYLWHVVRNRHFDLPDAGLRQTPRFRLDAIDGTEIAYQLDGDFAGTLPVEVDVLPSRLRLLVSVETAKRLGFTVSDDVDHRDTISPSCQ
jgi:diacylglycerol kinase family enzyme